MSNENEIKQPKWAKEIDVTSMKERATSLMTDIKEKTTPVILSAIDSVAKGSQEKMLQTNNVMSQNVGSLLKDLNGNSPTAEKLIELRECMDKLNPNSLRNSWWMGLAPKSIKRYVINNFIHKYEPMKNHVDSVLDGLRHGYDQLIELDIQMHTQYNELIETMKEIQADIYICDETLLLVEQFETEMDKNDQTEVQKVAQAKNKLVRKIRDLRTKEQAVNQFFVSIEQSFTNNNLLSEQIESALSVGPMVMYNALQIQAGLAKQDTISKGVAKFQEGLSDMMTQNAKATRIATEEIAGLWNNPVLALDKMSEGFNELMSAISTAQTAMNNSTQVGLEAIEKLKGMNEALSPTVQAMRENRENGGVLSEVSKEKIENKTEE